MHSPLIVFRYKDYEILGNYKHHSTRSNDGVYEIARDIEILSETDYLVCTLSSNVSKCSENFNFLKSFLVLS